MKLSFYAFLTAAFFGALLTLTAGTVRRDLDLLRVRLEDSNRELRDTRGEVDRLRGEGVYRMESLVPRAELEELRARLDTHDIRALYREVLAPSVQVSARGGVGGGTLLFSRPDHSY
ncbi:MAG TPA: hypothetical protein VEN81_02030, partial [Planctomycetota bacterium]|nr:hypothetical protein [Planctomycetota bacterium]